MTNPDGAALAAPPALGVLVCVRLAMRPHLARGATLSGAAWLSGAKWSRRASAVNTSMAASAGSMLIAAPAAAMSTAAAASVASAEHDGRNPLSATRGRPSCTLENRAHLISMCIGHSARCALLGPFERSPAGNTCCCAFASTPSCRLLCLAGSARPPIWRCFGWELKTKPPSMSPMKKIITPAAIVMAGQNWDVCSEGSPEPRSAGGGTVGQGGAEGAAAIRARVRSTGRLALGLPVSRRQPERFNPRGPRGNRPRVGQKGWSGRCWRAGGTCFGRGWP